MPNCMAQLVDIAGYSHWRSSDMVYIEKSKANLFSVQLDDEGDFRENLTASKQLTLTNSNSARSYSGYRFIMNSKKIFIFVMEIAHSYYKF